MESIKMQSFVQLISLVGYFYDKTVEEGVIEIFWKLLEEFTFSQVEDALHAHMKNPDAKRFPMVSDVIRYLKGSSENQALIAWSKVMKAISQVGSYSSIAFDDQIIHIVILDMGGWMKLCESTMEDLKFLQHEFQKRYAGYVLRPAQTYPEKLIGKSEFNNGQNGYENQQTVQFGKESTANVKQLSESVIQETGKMLHLENLSTNIFSTMIPSCTPLKIPEKERI